MAISDDQILFGTPLDNDITTNKTSLITSTAIALIVLTFAAVVLRFLSRWVIRVPFLLDDWLILAALPFALTLPAIDMYGATLGYFGRHLLVAPDPLGYLPVFLKGMFVYDICYNFAIALTKLSLLAIYWRIFHTKSVQLPLLITAGATMAWLVACTLVAIFSCVPVAGFWDPTVPSTCINNLLFWLGQAVCNIVLDIVLLAIPVFRVVKLSISTSQKVAVSGIFLIGAFTTICSALRLNELIRSLNVPTQDPTLELVGAGVWSIIESSLSIVCACLPTMRPLLRLILSGSPYPTTGNNPPAQTGNACYSRSNSRATSRTPSNWPLQKRISGLASPQRSSFRLSQPDGAHIAPPSPANGGAWEGWGERPLMQNARSFATNRYHTSATAGNKGECGDIEMTDRGYGGGDGSVGGSGGVGVARTTAFDEVSENENSVTTEDTDTFKHLEDTRPVDGF